MRAQHDIGGTDEGPVDPHPHEPSLFDRRVDALMMLLAAQCDFFSVDSQRRAGEDLAPDLYRGLAYYERWMHNIAVLMVERGQLTQAEIDRKVEAVRARVARDHDRGQAYAAGHHHDHDHAHDWDEDGPPGEYAVLEEAIRELSIEKGFFKAADVQRQIEDMDARTPSQGARLVAKAWTNPAFHNEVMRDAKAAAELLGIDMTTSPPIRAVQNAPALHHMVVCTLCSCYPRALLGVPPLWYKSRAYRARSVVDPRGVLAEFGTVLPDSTQIRVVDSTADLRYIVIPMRPEGTDAWTEAQLAPLVTRDAIIGVALARRPSA